MNASYRCAATRLLGAYLWIPTAACVGSAAHAQDVSTQLFYDLDTSANLDAPFVTDDKPAGSGFVTQSQFVTATPPGPNLSTALHGDVAQATGTTGAVAGKTSIADGFIASTVYATPLLQGWSGGLFVNADGAAGGANAQVAGLGTINAGPLATGDYLWSAYLSADGDPNMSVQASAQVNGAPVLQAGGLNPSTASGSGFISSGSQFGVSGSAFTGTMNAVSLDQTSGSVVGFFSYVGPLSSTIPIGGAVPGDVNWDGVKDATDIDLLSMAIGAGIDDPRFDLDGSSEPSTDLLGNAFNDPVTQADLDYLIQVCFGTAYGDANLDGVVDLLDFDILAQNFGQSGVGWSGGDVNRTTLAGPTAANPGGSPPDFVVDLLDFDVVAQNFGFGVPASVPEPASAALLGLAGVLAVRRRRR